MDIDITPIDNKNVDIQCFLEFASGELKKHVTLVKNKDYKRAAFCTSNKNKFKKYFEEIIPLMFFLEREKGTYRKIKYMSGDQKGDAILDDSIIVEVIKAQNNNKYLVMQDLLKSDYGFSAKNLQNKISTSLPTRTQPYVYTGYEHVKDAALYIRAAIERKLSINYPHGSILIIFLESDILMLECDGDYLRLENEIMNFKKGIFSKIYIMENSLNDDLRPKWQFIL